MTVSASIWRRILPKSTIFKNYGRGIATCRDEWDYDFGIENLANKVKRFIDNYNDEVDRWKARSDKKAPVDHFVSYDESKYKWSEGLKSNLVRQNKAEFAPKSIVSAMLRPYCKQWLYYDRMLIERVYQMPQIVPMAETSQENLAISITAPGCTKSFHSLMTDCIPDLHLTGDTQCFPLYTYALDGKIRRDNITDWALGQFQAKYGPSVTKRDIFHYVYALLHHPEYRERYKENLKRELPRLPLVADADGTVFPTYVTVGAELAALHVGYEDAAEYPLKEVVAEDVPFSWRVTKMRLSADKTAIKVNDSLTLTGIPPEAFGYRLGNRSALEWVLDQYQVTTDKRSGLVSDPNRADAPDYIARLVRRVVTVSVETQAQVGRLPGL